MTDDAGQELRGFPSKRALLQWARAEARRLLPEAEAPCVHLSARGGLLVHASQSAYEAWISRKRSVRRGVLRLGRVATRSVEQP